MMLVGNTNPIFKSTPLILPLGLYLVYTMRVLPGLRVFKHTFRGVGYARAGLHRQSLLALRRALQLAPNDPGARNAYWQVHCALDLDKLAGDPATLALVDFDLCLERAGTVLLLPSPGPEKLAEAHRLLDLVLSQRPALKAPVSYWRSVAFAHARDLDQSATELEQVLDPAHSSAADPYRQGVLFSAWQLALLVHDGLRQRVGLPQLQQPGRRMEAIAAVERFLAEQPQDTGGWNLKRVLYQDVTEANYEEALRARSVSEGNQSLANASGSLAAFDHEYAQQLGLALINDPERWQRGCEYLRMAVRGLPLLGPSIFVFVAQAHQRAGRAEESWHNYELAKQAGRTIGVRNLAGEEKQAYFLTLKLMGDAAMNHGRTDLAIENYQLYSESERSGVETLRTLAGLYEQKGDVMAALLTTEKALLYNSSDPDLLQRKDRYYYSVIPEWFSGHPDRVPRGFDLAYCVEKARTLLNAKEVDLDNLDWAQHLADLACAIKPESITSRVLLARAKLRRGEREAATSIFEDIHQQKPASFADGDEDSWYMMCRLLGDIYLNDYSRTIWLSTVTRSSRRATRAEPIRTSRSDRLTKCWAMCRRRSRLTSA